MPWLPSLNPSNPVVRGNPKDVLLCVAPFAGGFADLSPNMQAPTWQAGNPGLDPSLNSQVGSAISFRGGAKEVRWANRTGYPANRTNAFTCVALLWTNSQGTIFSMGEQIDSNDAVVFGVSNTTPNLCLGSPNTALVTSTLTVPLHQWCVVGISQASGTVRTFGLNKLDGTGVRTQAPAGTISTSAIGVTNPWSFGRSWVNAVVNAADDLDGAIGFLVLFKRAVTTAELVSLCSDPFQVLLSPPAQSLFWDLPFQPGAAGGGTTFTSSLSGVISQSGGLTLQTAKLFSTGWTWSATRSNAASKALVGTETPAASLAKQAQKPLTGSASPSGAWAYLRTIGKVLSGAVSSAGALSKSTAKSLTGSFSSGGGLNKLGQKALAGSVTLGSGTVSAVRLILRAFSGSLSPSATLSKAVSVAKTGALSLSAGLAKLANKPGFTGSLTPSGTYSSVRVILRTFASSLSLSAALTKSVSKSLVGAVSQSGTYTKLIAKGFASSVSPSGSYSATRLVFRAFSGSASLAGAATKSVRKALAGATTPAGALRKLISQARSAAVSLVAAFTKTTSIAEVGPVKVLRAVWQALSQSAFWRG